MDRQAENKDGNFCFQQENILQHMGLIKNIARQMTEMIPQEMPWEDVVQYGCIGLIEAMRNYEGEKGKISTFATAHIYGRIVDGIYAFRGQKRLRSCKRRSQYKIQLADPKGEWMLQEQLRIENERQQKDRESVEERISLEMVLCKLTQEEQKLIRSIYYENKTCEMCAVEEQKSVQWVRLMHRRILKKLRRWLLN